MSAGRPEYVTRRYIDERARACVAEVEHRLELLAAELVTDLERLVLLDRVERRDGVAIDWGRVRRYRRRLDRRKAVDSVRRADLDNTADRASLDQTHGVSRTVTSTTVRTPPASTPLSPPATASTGRPMRGQVDRCRPAECVAVYQRWMFLPYGDVVLAALGTAAANLLEAIPVWLLFVGSGGSGKSEAIAPLDALGRRPGIAIAAADDVLPPGAEQATCGHWLAYLDACRALHMTTGVSLRDVDRALYQAKDRPKHLRVSCVP